MTTQAARYPEREIFAYGSYIQCQIMNWRKGPPPRFLICNPLDGKHREPFLARQGMGTWMRVELRELDAVLNAPTAKNAEAKVREALEAFAEQSDRLHESVPDCMALAVNGAFGKGGGELKITVGHLRKARAALALLDGEGNG